MKVHLATCASAPDAASRQTAVLRDLFARSTPRLHSLVDSPEAADVIFLTNAQLQWGAALERHPLPHRFPEKCFALSDQWEPPFLLAGIYANAPRSAFWRGRFRTGSYALHHPDFRNQFVEAYDYATEAPRRTPDLLASFLGRNCHPVRAQLFATDFSSDRILIEDTSSFNAFTHGADGKVERQRYYFEMCLRSKFILSPRGAGPNSIRLFEALKLGIAPIILADAWIPCEGPQWNEFALFLPERDVSRIAPTLVRIEHEYEQRGRAARRAYEEFFAPAAYFNYLVSCAVSARRARVLPERVFVTLWPAARLLRRARNRVRHLLRSSPRKRADSSIQAAPAPVSTSATAAVITTPKS